MFDFVVAGSALIVSYVSLFVAVQHGKTMGKLVQATSFPNVEFTGHVEYLDKPGEIALSADLTNNGVGPARIESIELWENGVPPRSAIDIANAIRKAAGDAHSRANLEGSTLIGSLIGAGKTKTLVRFKFADAAKCYPELTKVLLGLESRVCYCSVFDECHVSDSRVLRGRPTVGANCHTPALSYKDDFSNLALRTPGAPPSVTIELSPEQPNP